MVASYSGGSPDELMTQNLPASYRPAPRRISQQNAFDMTNIKTSHR